MNVNWSNWETEYIYKLIFQGNNFDFIRDFEDYDKKSLGYLSALVQLSVINMLLKVDAEKTLEDIVKGHESEDNFIMNAFNGHKYENKIRGLFLIAYEVLSRVDFEEITGVVFPEKS